MVEAIQPKLRRVLKLYLVTGLLVGGVKLASILVWFLAAATGQVGSNYVAGDFTGILFMGLGGVVLAIVGWPIVLYNVLTGSASLPTVLFFPWVTSL